MIKGIHTLYFSPTGATQKIVKEIGRGMGYAICEHNVTLPSDRTEALELKEEELLLVAVPVYSGRVPEVVTEYLQKIKGSHTKAVYVVVYGNRAYEDALLELKNILEDKGFSGIAGGAFVGEHSYTSLVGEARPDEEDLERAFNFGTEVKKLLSQLKNSSLIVDLSVNGKQPYREKMALPPMAPETLETCTQCGVCAKVCPTGAIDPLDFSLTDGTKCIRCFACVKNCPVKAKVFNHEFITKITQTLIQNCSAVRKEPEVFFIDC